MQAENKSEELLQRFENIKKLLMNRASEIHQREKLKDLEAKRTDLERRTALFTPSRQRLEKGGKTLALGEDYENIKELRSMRGKNKIRQDSLRDELTTARAELRSSEESLSVTEAEYRDRLAAQSQLHNTVIRVKAIDAQIKDRKDAVNQAREEYDGADRQYKECSEKLEKERAQLEKMELEMRETRKFLQFHSSDEKLQANLPGIQKCFSMFESAEEKKHELKDSWSQAIENRQKAQNILKNTFKQ